VNDIKGTWHFSKDYNGIHTQGLTFQRRMRFACADGRKQRQQITYPIFGILKLRQ
jgi:hypothetical protein